MLLITHWAVGSLIVRASDSRPEGLGSMPDATKHPPSTHGFTCRNCGGGDRGPVAIYRPFGEFRRAKIVLSPTCMVLKANDRRTSCPCHDEFRGPRSDYVRQKIDGAVIEQRNRQIPKRGSEDDSDELDRREQIEGCRNKMLHLQWSLNNVVC
ncbi:uncharacterized protein TNCV_2160151 [Trichonephila clavipes]|nr:uncharacterized protein TNCV_2160151 [Trichonephila clavipes]